MVINISFIKNYPASNLNRDDSNCVKTTVFGDVTRARISSQCFKHAMRENPIFQKEVGEILGIDSVAYRTRKLPELVKNELVAQGVDEKTAIAAATVMTKFGTNSKEEKTNDEVAENPTNEKQNNTKKDKPKKNEVLATGQLLFFTQSELKLLCSNLCSFIKEQKIDEKQFSKMSYGDFEKNLVKFVEKKGENIGDNSLSAISIMLTGRMSTSPLLSNVDACLHVAHAFSTNEFTAESDYFSALDTLTDSGEGSGMLGGVDFTCPCMFYNMAIFCDDMRKEFDDAEMFKKLITSIIKAALMTDPSGKQTSFMARALPVAVYIECNESNLNYTLADAFIKPVTRNDDSDTIEQSIKNLANEIDNKMMDTGSLYKSKRLWFCTNKYSVAPKCVDIKCKSLSDIIESVCEEIK